MGDWHDENEICRLKENFTYFILFISENTNGNKSGKDREEQRNTSRFKRQTIVLSRHLPECKEHHVKMKVT